MNSYKVYISSLKGFACLFVMIGHFFSVAFSAESLAIGEGLLKFLSQSHLQFLFDAGFWLFLFFVVSGYLCANSQIKNSKEFIIKSLCRFLRLAIPIFFACVIILLIYYTIGFHNAETITIFQNNWFQKFYKENLNIVYLIRSPFDTLLFNKCYFNSPYWVLRHMLVGSFLIYFTTYIVDKIKKPFSVIFILLVLITSFFVSRIAFACMVGMLLCRYEKQFAKHFNYKITIAILILTFILQMLFTNDFISIFLFSILLIFIPKSKYLIKVLQTDFGDYLGKISFGIYSFHWPIFCSVGSLALIFLNKYIGTGYAMILASIITVILTVPISIIYNLTAEKWSSKIIVFLRMQLFRIADKFKFKKEF